MSTQNGKCPGCGEGEMHASSGVIVYVCGTTLSQYGTNRSTTCHGIETATLWRRIGQLVEHVARLETAGDACAETATTPHQMAWERAKEAKP